MSSSMQQIDFDGGIREKVLFSVIIPTYNRLKTIGHAIDSVLQQTFKSYEIIIVDDGSTEDIEKFVLSYRNGKIVFFKQDNRGASAARNKGIDLARGKFIAFLDSDDVFLPNHLSSMADIVFKDRNVAAYSPIKVKRDSGFFIKPPRAIRPDESMACYLMCDRGFVQPSGLVVSKDAAHSVRYREDVSFGDDTDFVVRLALFGVRFKMAMEPSVIWSDRIDPDRLSNLPNETLSFRWLEDLRGLIPERAYKGYRGWHVAKNVFRKRPDQSFLLYFIALFSGSYRPSLAIVVFCQIVMPYMYYRILTDFFIRLSTFLRSFRFLHCVN